MRYTKTEWSWCCYTLINYLHSLRLLIFINNTGASFTLYILILYMANTIVDWAVNTLNSWFKEWFTADLLWMAAEFLPKLWLAILIWIVFWFLAKAVKGIVTRLAHTLWVEKLADKVNMNTFLQQANIKSWLSGLFWKIVYWVIYLIGINISLDTLWLDVVSQLISDLIAYIPNLFVAIVIILIWTFIAKFIRDIINGAVAASNSPINWAGKAGYIAVMFFVVITALKQAQVDISFLTDNVNTIVMWIMLALWLAFGLGWKDKAKDTLDKWM